MAAKCWPWLRGLGLAVLALAWVIAGHWNSVNDESSGWGAAIALTPMLLAAATTLWHLPFKWLAAALGVALATGLWWAWPIIKGEVAFLHYLEHLGVYSLLAVFFGRSLLGPREALISQLARRVHGGALTERQRRYTGQATLAWTGFFVGMAAVSTALFIWASAGAWATFAMLLGGPLIALMFVAEYGWRCLALPPQERATFAQAVRAWRTHESEAS